MQKRKARRIQRPLKPEEQKRLHLRRKEAEEDREQIKNTARQAKAEHDAALSEIRQAIDALRAERTAARFEPGGRERTADLRVRGEKKIAHPHTTSN